jgi:hypothetical protein
MQIRNHVSQHKLGETLLFNLTKLQICVRVLYIHGCIYPQMAHIYESQQRAKRQTVRLLNYKSVDNWRETN